MHFAMGPLPAIILPTLTMPFYPTVIYIAYEHLNLRYVYAASQPSLLSNIH